MDFSRLTQATQRVFDGAHREAFRLDHATIQPEHVALGLAMDRDGDGAKILEKLGVDPDAFKLKVERTLEPGAPVDSDEIEFGARTRHLIRVAEEEARQLEQFGVGGEHLLLALLAQDRGEVRQILNEMGVTYQQVRQHLERGLGMRRVLVRTGRVLTGLGDTLREPFRLAVGKHIPVEVNLVFIGLVLVTLIFGILLWLRVLPVISLIFFVIVGWVISVALHEFGHALVAYISGDVEVHYKGYLSLNPIKYTHPILSIVLPLVILFLGGIGLPGGAVYINRHALPDKRMRSMVSAAGPFATLLCAVVLLIPFMTGLAYIDPEGHPEFWAGVAMLAMLEISAILLNLLPIPGLDGFGVIEPYLPVNIVSKADKLRQFTFWFLVFFFITPLADVFWIVVTFFSRLVNLDFDLVLLGLDIFRFWS